MPPRRELEDWDSYARRINIPPTNQNLERLVEQENRRLRRDAIEQMNGARGILQPPTSNGGSVSIEEINRASANINSTISPAGQPLQSMEWVESPAVRRIQTPQGAFNVTADSISAFYDELTDAPKKSPTKAKPMDAKTEKRQLDALNIIRKEREKAIAEKPRINGRKSSEYIHLLQNEKEKGMTIKEIVYTEIPIGIEEINHRKLDEVITSGIAKIQRGSNGYWEFVCSACGLNGFTWCMFFLNGKLYCAEHIPNIKMCGVCDTLVEGCKSIHTFDNRDILMCPSCIQRSGRCRYCENTIPNAYWEIRTCAPCLDRTSTEAPFKRFSRGLAWVGSETGNVIKTKRMFSAEVEGLTPQRSYASNLYTHLPKEMGIANDGSVDGSREGLYGFEVITPRLAGKKGEELINHMVAVLKNLETSVNETCGMHVHLDGKGIILADRKAYPAALIQLWKTYIVFEDVIMSFLPFARRANDYCRPLSEAFKLSEFETVETLIDAEKLWYKERTPQDMRQAKQHHYHSSRYFSINFHCLFGEGHLEVRSHSGTTNARKILEWANLHALIADAAENKMFTPEFLKEAQTTSELREKTSMLFNRIGLSEKSRQYYRTRQRKFGDKKNEEDEPRAKKKKRVGLPTLEATSSVRFSIPEPLLSSEDTEILSQVIDQALRDNQPL